MTHDVESFTDVDRSPSYDVIEERLERYEATRLRRASGKKGERSNFEGERSNTEGERSNTEGDGGKNFGFAATQAASHAKS